MDYADGLHPRGKRVVVGNYEGRNAIDAIRAMIADRISPEFRDGERERVLGSRRVAFCGITIEAKPVRGFLGRPTKL